MAPRSADDDNGAPSMSNLLTTFIAGVCVVVAVVVVIRSQRNRSSRLDALIDASLAEEIADRTGLSRDVVLRAIAGEGTSDDVIRRIDDCLVHVDVETARLDGRPDRVQVRRRAVFADGAVRELTWETSWDSLPASVRESFRRSGEPTVLGAWAPPWRSAG
jgi:hypothetical protein